MIVHWTLYGQLSFEITWFYRRSRIGWAEQTFWNCGYFFVQGYSSAQDVPAIHFLCSLSKLVTYSGLELSQILNDIRKGQQHDSCQAHFMLQKKCTQHLQVSYLDLPMFFSFPKCALAAYLFSSYLSFYINMYLKSVSEREKKSEFFLILWKQIFSLHVKRAPSM